MCVLSWFESTGCGGRLALLECCRRWLWWSKVGRVELRPVQSVHTYICRDISRHCGCVCTYLFSECCNTRKRKWGGKLLRRSRMSALTCSLSQHCMHTLLKSQILPHRGIQANTSACTVYVLSSAVAAASRGDEERLSSECCCRRAASRDSEGSDCTPRRSWDKCRDATQL